MLRISVGNVISVVSVEV